MLTSFQAQIIPYYCNKEYVEIGIFSLVFFIKELEKASIAIYNSQNMKNIASVVKQVYLCLAISSQLTSRSSLLFLLVYPCHIAATV